MKAPWRRSDVLPEWAALLVIALLPIGICLIAYLVSVAIALS